MHLSSLPWKNGRVRIIFYGVIIVPAESAIQDINELKGYSFAFGDKRSTIGRYLSQKALIEAGIHAHNLSGFDYLGRHDKVFDAVALHKYDAGAVKETTVSRYNNSNMVRVISRLKNMTKPWISRAGPDRSILQTLRTSLLRLKDAVLLKELKVTGFLPATDADYEATRQSMQMAEEFGG